MEIILTLVLLLLFLSPLSLSSLSLPLSLPLSLSPSLSLSLSLPLSLSLSGTVLSPCGGVWPTQTPSSWWILKNLSVKWPKRWSMPREPWSEPPLIFSNLLLPSPHHCLLLFSSTLSSLIHTNLPFSLFPSLTPLSSSLTLLHPHTHPPTHTHTHTHTQEPEKGHQTRGSRVGPGDGESTKCRQHTPSDTGTGDHALPMLWAVLSLWYLQLRPQC